jgi:hypothetical protein
MTQAVATRRDGDTFQARMFWLKAARLFDEHGCVARVGFEHGPKGFDDVWVEYEPGRAPQDQFGMPLQVERMQCKWHATPGTFTHEALIDPAYVNATSASLLQRALQAFRTDRSSGHATRLSLVKNHMVDPADTLSSLIRTKCLTLDIDGLFSGKTTRSATGQLRKAWCDHLQIDDSELRELCARLSFNSTRESLDALRDMLDDACRANGLVRPQPNASTTVYDSNIFEWVGQRRTVFDRKTFREKCTQEGLLVSRSKSVSLYGIKSFEHALDRLEDRCEDVLNLVPEFNDRLIRDDAAWCSKLVPRLKTFLTGVPAPDGRVRLAIEVHATLAFAAGAILGTKSGRVVELEQRSPARQLWAQDDQPLTADLPTWSFIEHELDVDGAGTAVAISVTRDTEAAVRRYISENALKVRTLLVASPVGGASPRAVASGAHANALAESLAVRLKRDREAKATSSNDRYHLFISAPNALTFYLGRQAPALAPWTLYEFDFDYQVDGSYRPSLSFPEMNPPGQ